VQGYRYGRPALLADLQTRFAETDGTGTPQRRRA
jgi:hypothetical protein